MKGMLSKLLLVGLALAAFTGCSEGVGDINRVQPNYYKKSQFQGDWYFKQTIIDVPYENSWVFEGQTNEVEKIHWEIQEDALIAYRRNEFVPGANGAPDDGSPKFTPVAAYRIEKHFDIQRNYNPSTGEQGNVIDENTSDRPWYERDYIRVDWSKNLSPNYNGFDVILPLMGMSGLSYWVQDHEVTNPDRFEISDDYIGVVGRYSVEPDFWACRGLLADQFQMTSDTNCGPTTIKIRSSFAKIDPNAPKYEPLHYGPSVPLQPTVDVNNDGVVDDEDRIDRVLQIPSKITRVDNGDGTQSLRYGDWTIVPCTAEVMNALALDPFYASENFGYDDCEPADGAQMFGKFGFFRSERVVYDRLWGHTEESRLFFANRWDIWESSYDDAGNPLPYGDRKVKPIVYYLNPDFPEDLHGAVEEIENQWDFAFRRAVAAAQGKIGADGTPLVDEVPQVFEIRENSCSLSNLRELSGTRKYNSVIKDVVGSVDNVTKENIEQVCAALEYYTDFEWQKNGDIRYSVVYWVDRPQAAGPLGYGPSSADPETGEIINGTAYVYGAGVDRQANRATEIVEFLSGRLDLHEVIDGTTMRRLVRRNAEKSAQESKPVSESFKNRLMAARAALSETEGKGGAVKVPAGSAEARLRKIEGTHWQAEIFNNNDMLSVFANNMGVSVDELPESIKRKFDPIYMASEQAALDRESRLLKLTAKHCTYMEEFADPSIIGLAIEYDADGKSRDEIFQDVREKIFIGVMLHEIGHTLGLRHNFEGSVDALNYHDDFWEYFELDPNPSVARSETSDPEVQQRLDRCINKAADWGYELGVSLTTLDCLKAVELKQSSIMDYGAKFNSDFLGLGKYDRAAIAFGYTQMVEVFKPEVPMPEVHATGTARLSTIMMLNDYKKIPTPEMFGSRENIMKRELRPYDEIVTAWANRVVEQGMNLPVFDNQFNCLENCDYTYYNPEMVEVPYRFCSDEYSYWSVDCKRWDEGANQTEIIQSMIDSYRTYYPLSAFKRDRMNFMPFSYALSLNANVFRHFKLAYQYLFYYGDTIYRDTDWVTDFTTASINGLNLLAEVLQSPEPGIHCWIEDEQKFISQAELERYCPDRTKMLDIPVGEGRYYWHDWESDGYYWRIIRAGSNVEKQLAMFQLADPIARFYGTVATDENYSINYYRLFKDEVLKLFGGLIVEDPTLAGGRVVKEGQLYSYRPNKLVDPETWRTNTTAPEIGDVIKPGTSYFDKWYAGLYGMALLNSTLDKSLDFRNYFKVGLKGSVEDLDYEGIDFNDPSQYAEFVDPRTHNVFRAAVTERPDLSFGLKLVHKANAVKADVWQPAKDELDAATDALETDPTAENEARYQNAMARFKVAEEEMAKVSEFMADFRALSYFFQYTPQ